MGCCDSSSPFVPDDALPFMAATITASPAAAAAYAAFHTTGARSTFLKQIRLTNTSAAPAYVGFVFATADGTASASVAGQPTMRTTIASVSEIQTAWTAAPTPAAVYLVRTMIPAGVGQSVVIDLCGPVLFVTGAARTSGLLINLDSVAGPPLEVSMAWVEDTP